MLTVFEKMKMAKEGRNYHDIKDAAIKDLEKQHHQQEAMREAQKPRNLNLNVRIKKK